MKVTSSNAPQDQSCLARIAIIVVHGMGKQVHFETLDCIAGILSREHQQRHSIDAKIRVTHDRQDGKLTPRVELALPMPDESVTQLHLFEAYWAPLTVGKVTAWDVTRFLHGAAWTGLWRNRKGHFSRWLFGHLREFSFPWQSLRALFGTYFILLILWVGYALLLSSAVAHIASLQHILSGLAGKSLNDIWEAAMTSLTLGMILWILIYLFLRWLKGLYIQYIGDVAAYVSSHDVSRFNELRNQIQTTVCDLTRSVYNRKLANGELQYQRILLLGHSLGSVLAYDALNRLILEDEIAGENNHITQRTGLLLTFGSPLDKTAFIFRSMKENAVVREALAANRQPLIDNYSYRPEHWINIYSPFDVISGPLEYYDLPHPTPSDSKAVENVRDPDACIPFLAHIQYWNGATLARIVYDAI
ncbi:hypothetical protein KKC97_13120 [bacterium]|nr:hypothetical protein [bacterium]MBU1638597.1 hypothetical protein [bacterium]